jgi:hypothetical protein
MPSSNIATDTPSPPNTPSVLKNNPLRRSDKPRRYDQPAAMNSTPPSTNHGPHKNVYQRTTAHSSELGGPCMKPPSISEPAPTMRLPCQASSVPAPQASPGQDEQHPAREEPAAPLPEEGEREKPGEDLHMAPVIHNTATNQGTRSSWASRTRSGETVLSRPPVPPAAQ